jgi:CRP-like cAMP-binding protein
MIAIMNLDLSTLLEGLPHREMAFPAGTAVFRLGDRVESLHFVRSGIIHLVRYQSDGSPLVLQRAGAGAMLAEASVYSARYHCDAYAETAAATWLFKLNDFRGRLAGSPAFAETWARHLAHEVQNARLHSEILSLKTVAARLDAWRAWHGALPPKGSWSMIANEIGVSSEALYREIGRQRKTFGQT